MIQPTRTALQNEADSLLNKNTEYGEKPELFSESELNIGVPEKRITKDSPHWVEAKKREYTTGVGVPPERKAWIEGEERARKRLIEQQKQGPFHESWIAAQDDRRKSVKTYLTRKYSQDIDKYALGITQEKPKIPDEAAFLEEHLSRFNPITAPSDNFVEEKDIYDNQVLNYYQVPIVDTEEEGNSLPIADNKPFAVRNKVEGEPAFLFYLRNERTPQERDVFDNLSQIRSGVIDWARQTVQDTEKVALTGSQAVANSFLSLYTILPEMHLGFTRYSPFTTNLGTLGLGHKYSDVAVGWLRQAFAPEWAFTKAGKKYGVLDEGESYEAGKKAFREEDEARMASKGISWRNPDKTLEDLFESHEDYAYDLEKALVNLEAFKGVDYRQSLLGRATKFFGEESVINRLFAFHKFRKGMKIFKGWAAKEFDTAEKVADKLGISVKKAGNLIKAHNQATNPILKSLYLAEETKAALGFTMGFTYMQNVDSNGIPETDLQSNGIALASGLATSIGITPASAVASKGKWSLMSILYAIMDKVKPEEGLIKISRREVDQKLRAINPNVSEKEVDAAFYNDPDNIRYKKRVDKGKRSYLLARGYHPIEVQNKIDDGSIHEFVGRLEATDQIGDVGKLLKHLDELPDEQLREEIFIMAKTSFDALEKIAEFGRRELGLDVHVYVDNILNLANIQIAKTQLMHQSGGMFGNFFKKTFGSHEYEALLLNEENLQNSLSAFIKQLDTKFGNNGENLASVADDGTAKLLSWAKKTGERMLDESRISVERLAMANSTRGIEIRQTLDKAREEVLATFPTIEDTVIRTYSTELLFNGTVRNIPIKADDLTPENFQITVNKISEEVGIPPKQAEEILKRYDYDGSSMLEKDLSRADELWDEVKASADIRFDADPILRPIFDKYIDNPEVITAIFDLVMSGISTSKMKHLINRITDGTVDKLDISFYNDLKSIVLDQISGNTKAVTELTNRLDDLSPENGFALLKTRVKRFGIKDKINLIPKELSMQEIKMLNTYLSKQTFLHSGDPQGVVFREIRESLDDVLENADLTGFEKSIVEKYNLARTLWKEHAQAWKRGPVNLSRQRDRWGDPVLAHEGLFDAFLAEGLVVKNRESFNRLLRGTPVGFDETTGKYRYLGRTKKERQALETLMQDAIIKKLSDESISKDNMRAILDAFGSQYKGQKNILSREQTDAYRKYMNVKFRHLHIIDEATQANIKKMDDSIRSLGRDLEQSVSDSMIGALSDMTKKGTTSQKVMDFLGSRTIIQTANLTEEMMLRYNRDFTRSTMPLEGASEDLLRIGSKVVKDDEIIMTSLDYLKLLTHNFQGESLASIRKRVGPRVKDATVRLMAEKSKKEATQIRGYLDDMLTDHVISKIIQPIDQKVWTEGKTQIMKRINAPDFYSTLQEVGAMRKAIWGENKNDILDIAYQASIHLMKGRSAALQQSGDIMDLPKKMKGSAVLSRIYSWQRGVVGLRYLLGEAGVRELRKGQAQELRRIFTDKDAARVLVDMMEVSRGAPESMKGWRKHFNSRARALSYATGLNITTVELIFTEDEMSRFLGEEKEETAGDIPISTQRKAKRLAEARKKYLALKGSPPTPKAMALQAQSENYQFNKDKIERLRREAGFVTQKELEERQSRMSFIG